MIFYSTYSIENPSNPMFIRIFWCDKKAERFCKLHVNVTYKPFNFTLSPEEREKFCSKFLKSKLKKKELMA